MFPDLSPSDILREVVETPRRAFAPIPDLRVVEREGWFQIITPWFRRGGFNEIAHAVLAEPDADAVIDRTIAEYRALGIAFRWTVGPGSAPADLGERLARRGLVRSHSRGMARSTRIEHALPPGVTVEEIDTSRIDTYTDVMAQGWDTDPALLHAVHEAVLSVPASERRQRLFLAYVDGVPAGTASYVAFPRSAYLLGGVVLPAFRRRGAYRALVTARLADARQRGLVLATTRARESTSVPLLERLGFATVCRFVDYAG